MPEGIPPAVASLKLAFCMVTGEIKPRTDSDIKFELWLPGRGLEWKVPSSRERWICGINFRGCRLLQPLFGGYAAIATDDGHAGSAVDAKWAPAHPEKVIDFGYRAVHEVSTAAKEIVRDFLAKPRRIPISPAVLMAAGKR